MAPSLTQIGKYQIERELGRGAMGVVYQAFDPVVERRVAIKTIRLDVEDAESLLNRLRREAKSVGQLEHANIVTLYDAGESEGLFYLAMQFIQGETLQDLVNRQRWFTLPVVQNLFKQICAGLDYAHEHGVIHRDIKPANIMITTEGLVKLTDFGIAKLEGSRSSTSGLIVGTPSYMSPEQAVGKPLDGRSDIFSLGSILYELLTGEMAFPGQNVTTVMYKIIHESPTPVAALQPGLDPAVEAIVIKALAKRPESRFQTCAELDAALDACGRISEAPRIAPTYVAPPPPVGAPTPFETPRVDTGSSSGAPGPSPGGQSLSVPQASGAVQTGSSQAGVPLAWVGGGVLGTLLLVILILMLVQMRNPGVTSSPPTSNPKASEASSPQTSAPSSSSPSAANSQTSNPSGSPPTAIAPGSKPSTSPSDLSISPARKSEITPVQKPKESAQRRASATLLPPPRSETAKHSEVAPVRVSPPQPEQPETFDSLLLKGDLAFQESHYENALASYKKAYQLKPSSAEVRRKITVVLTLLGRPEEASQYH